jgi:glyoxylate/hydroxypyruvate reductase A
MPVNVGRGKHVVDEDLIKALNSGQLSYAAFRRVAA